MSKPACRLYIDAPFATGAEVPASEAQAHYLLHVIRVSAGNTVALFNGRDGEWHATVSVPAKRRVNFQLTAQVRPQIAAPDLWLAFAPVKRVEFLAEKASELG